MLSSEISTYLTGRYISIPIYTLSFSEYLEFRKKFEDIQNPHDEWINYLKWGGFPAIHLRSMDINEAYLLVKDIYNTTIYTDIVKRNQIRKVDLLERIVRFAFDNAGKTFSAQSVVNFLKNEKKTIDIETIYNYLSKLEKAFILNKCLRMNLQNREILKLQEKYYLADSSLKYAIVGYQETSVSAMLENLVYLELLRRGYQVYIGKIGDKEIDFAAERGGDWIYIQVAKEINNEQTAIREYENLLAINDNYPKYVITTSNLAGGNYKGIKSLHIADFLMNTNI